MHAPTPWGFSAAGWIMLAAGLALGGTGLFLLARRHAFTAETPAAYAARIAGTMLTMLGTLLIAFALALDRAR